MNQDLHEPDDKAIEGANKAANGCGLVITGAIICIIIYCAWVAFSL